MLAIVCLIAGVTASAQTYTTINNGDWTSSATWLGGLVPPSETIPATAVINIRHVVTVSSALISNSGTINIMNPGGVSPRLILASGTYFENQLTGKLIVNKAEFRQHRFVGGGESGTRQTGSLTNKGGFISMSSSYIEVADNFINQNMGVRIIFNSSVTTGMDFKATSNCFDTLHYASVSCGWSGTAGDFTMNGGFLSIKSLRVQVASTAGNFRISGSVTEGDIDYITMRNHKTNVTSLGTITFSNSITTSGINVGAYCATSAAAYITNSKTTGLQSPDCGSTNTYFPASLFASITPGQLNFSMDPVLISGTDKQVGATYKYESVAPGIDAIVRIDSLVNGATLVMLDDNATGSGFKEALQPQVRSGNAPGSYYVVLGITHKLTGTDVNHEMATFIVTGLDIDGTSTVKEFQEFHVGAGAVSSFFVGSPQIHVTQVAPGAFRGINISGVTVNGVDTTTLSHMFSVSSAKVMSYTIKVGIVQTSSTAVTRLFSNYYKGFVYPANTTLPVKMESFTAMLINHTKKVDLKWTTASEVNTSHFVIERSIDGNNYSDIGIAFAFGDLSTKTNYSMVDDITGLKSTIIYYRIRSVDNDSKSSYSDTRIIRMGSAVNDKLTIMTYPNPVTNELRITVPDSWQNKQVQYELVSGNGTIVNKTTVANSNQTETMNVSKLAPGFYILRAVCNGVMAQQKIIKH